MYSSIKYLVLVIEFYFVFFMVLIDETEYVLSDRLEQSHAINELLSSNCLFYACECSGNLIRCPNLNSSYSSSPKLIMFPKRHYLSNYLSIRIDLDLSNNLIHSTPDDRLAYLNLNKLNLSSNQLTRISPDTFRDVTRLECLDLSRNKLDYLSMNIFKPISLSLSELLFSYNQLSNMETNRLSSILNDLKRLNSLDLAYNRLNYMPDLKEITSLKNLSIAHNNLEYLTDSDSNEQLLPNSLVRLNLEHNELKHLNENSFGRLTRLEYLNLGYNQISEIAEDTFVHLVNLVELNLSNNNFKLIPSRIFFTLVNLNHLNLSAQKPPIRVVDNYAFDRKSNRKPISLIDLSSNQIELITTRAFCSRASLSKYVNINELDLTRNRLTSLDVCLVRQLSLGNQLNRVMIRLNATSENKLECTCDLTRLAEIDICTNCGNYSISSIDAYCSRFAQYECFTEQKATKPFLIYLKQPTVFNITQINNTYTNNLVKNLPLDYNWISSINNLTFNSIINSTINRNSNYRTNKSTRKSLRLNVLIVCLLMNIFCVK